MKNYLVIDLEATCSDDGSIGREEMEIIEIGAVVVSAANHEPLAEYQSFIRPVRNSVLTDFCRSLTNISQSQVDSAKTFPNVLVPFMVWADQYSPFTFCSWGNYDRSQFIQDCSFHSVVYPFGPGHINLKEQFAKARGRKKKVGVPSALQSVGLSFSGSHHRGIDDARNIARLIPFIFPKAVG
jgi:3'-5' exoribonuclease 1